jgi:hypothetical protein
LSRNGEVLYDRYQVADAARLAGVSRAYMHRLIASGRIGTVNVRLGGGAIRRYVAGVSLAKYCHEREERLARLREAQAKSKGGRA